MGIALRPS